MVRLNCCDANYRTNGYPMFRENRLTAAPDHQINSDFDCHRNWPPRMLVTWTSNSSRSAIVWSANEKISFFDMLIWSKWIARISSIRWARTRAHVTASRCHAVHCDFFICFSNFSLNFPLTLFHFVQRTHNQFNIIYPAKCTENGNCILCFYSFVFHALGLLTH